MTGVVLLVGLQIGDKEEKRIVRFLCFEKIEHPIRHGIDAVAIRFPMLHHHDARCRVASGDETETDILEAFTGLSYDDAAELVLATLRAPTPGYRCYMPATTHRHLDLPVIWIPHSYAACSQHAPDEHILMPVARSALAVMAGLYWDIGAGETPKGA